MSYELKLVLENKATKSINESAIKDFDFHINQMKKNIKWYNKIPSMMINFLTPALAFGSYISIAAFSYEFLKTGNDDPLSMMLAGFLNLLLFYWLAMSQTYGEKYPFITTLKSFLFLDFKKRHLHVLEDCSKHELSLESMRKITDCVSADELKEILNYNDGKITYSDIFKSSIPYIYNSIEYNKHLDVKKVKADVLVDQIYEERKAIEK